MKPTQSISLAICLLAALSFTTGCQSGFIKKPELGRLAFWKKDNLQLASRVDDVPPPSKHFSPDPAGSTGSANKNTAIANNGSQNKGSANKNPMTKANIDSIIANAKQTTDDAADSLKKTITDPIRKPYSLDSLGTKVAAGLANEQSAGSTSKTIKSIQSGSNDFVAGAASQFKAVKDSTLAATENTFNAATESAGSATKSLDNWKTTLEKATQDQAAKAAQEVASTANQAVAATTDAIGEVSQATTKTANQTVASIADSVADNSFEPSGETMVVKNPYSDLKSTATSSTTASLDNGFVSKYKNTPAATATVSAPTATSANANLIKNQNFTNKQLAPNLVSQSSYNSNIERTANNLLQPRGSATPAATRTNTTPAATGYPSTGFETFNPVQRTSNENSGDSGSEVYKIPASLLRGTSTFAPGSTKPLRPSQASN